MPHVSEESPIATAWWLGALFGAALGFAAGWAARLAMEVLR